MPKQLTSACISGLLSSGLYFVVFGSGLGFIFMFLPTLPLFFQGLRKDIGGSYAGIIVAAFIISIVAGISAGVSFVMFLGLPSWYMARKSLLHTVNSANKPQQWYPVGYTVLSLTLYACVAVAFVTLYYAGQQVALPQILSQNIHEAFSDLEVEYGDIIDQMANGLSFLVFPITIWLWCIILYAHAWLANKLLIRSGSELRPSLKIDVFFMPSWMLSLLAICALASLIGSPSMSFLGKSTLIALLCPYFFLGIALMHNYCKSWPNARFFLFFVYFMVLSQFWPALILSGIGLWHQIKTLNKHLSETGTSSNN